MTGNCWKLVALFKVKVNISHINIYSSLTYIGYVEPNVKITSCNFFFYSSCISPLHSISLTWLFWFSDSTWYMLMWKHCRLLIGQRGTFPQLVFQLHLLPSVSLPLSFYLSCDKKTKHSFNLWLFPYVSALSLAFIAFSCNAPMKTSYTQGIPCCAVPLTKSRLESWQYHVLEKR